MTPEGAANVIEDAAKSYPFESIRIEKGDKGLIVKAHYKGKERVATVPYKGVRMNQVQKRAREALDDMLDQ